MNKWRFFLIFFIFFSSSLHAKFISEISLARQNFDRACGSYLGLRVNINVFEKTSNGERKNIWKGSLRIKPNQYISSVFQYRKLYPLDIKFKYYLFENYFKYNPTEPPSYSESDPIKKMNEYVNQCGYFEYEKTMYEVEVDSVNLVIWKIEDLFLKIETIIQTVKKMKKNDKYPQYKFLGYDWDLYVVNCVTFSVLFLKKLGIQIEKCKDLVPWLKTIQNQAFKKYCYYLFGLGFTKDNIQSHYVLGEIFKNKEEVIWIFDQKRSPTPRFSIELLDELKK